MSYRDSATVWCTIRYGLCHEFNAKLCPENSGIYKKILSLQTDKELFESMSNMVIINSLLFPYPLPVLMRVLHKSLIVYKILHTITNISKFGEIEKYFVL